MKCYICRRQLGEGHEPVFLVVGRGDETEARGGFQLCGRCGSALVRAWMLIQGMVFQFYAQKEATGDYQSPGVGGGGETRQ